MLTSILYENPLNERLRTFLRLEQLFFQVENFQNSRSIWDSHASITAFLEILSILERTDIRSEALKELDRHMTTLLKLFDTPHIDKLRLDKTLQELKIESQKLHLLPSKLESTIRDNELLNSVRQRTALMGGTCSFDIPAYHYWLNQPSQIKSQCLQAWLQEIQPIKTSIDLLLNLTRNSAFFEPHTAINGFYQKNSDPQNPCKLLRIALPADSSVYPEVSGNKHRINIRFLTYINSKRPQQINYNLEFEMSSCIL